MGLILESGRSPGGEHGSPLQYSCLENPPGQKSLWRGVGGYSPQGHTELDTTDPPEDLPNPGIQPKSLKTPALAVRFFTNSTSREALRAFLKNPFLGQPFITALPRENQLLLSWVFPQSLISTSVQLDSVAQLCPTLCDHMDCHRPGFTVHHQLLELAQTHVRQVGDAIQPSHPLIGTYLEHLHATYYIPQEL